MRGFLFALLFSVLATPAFGQTAVPTHDGGRIAVTVKSSSVKDKSVLVEARHGRKDFELSLIHISCAFLIVEDKRINLGLPTKAGSQLTPKASH